MSSFVKFYAVRSNSAILAMNKECSVSEYQKKEIISINPNNISHFEVKFEEDNNIHSIFVAMNNSNNLYIEAKGSKSEMEREVNRASLHQLYIDLNNL